MTKHTKIDSSIITAVSNGPVSVQNGTEIVSPTVAELVKQYRLFVGKTAENVLRLAETVAEVDNSLSESDQLKFCLQVGLKHKGPAYRKRLNIGKKASRFGSLLERLPSCWTTLYKLSTLDNDRFDMVTQDERFCPTIRASQIDAIVGNKPKSAKELSPDVTIDLSGLANDAKIKVCRQIKNLKRTFGFYLKFRNEIAELASDSLAEPEYLS